MIVGPAFAIAGMGLLAFQPSSTFIAVAAVLAYAGFASARPGVAAASSYSLPMARQGEVAAAILSTAWVGIVAGPVMSMLLYTFWRPLPFVVMGGMLAVALAIAIRCPHIIEAAFETVGTDESGSLG
jgi:MFS family permease